MAQAQVNTTSQLKQLSDGNPDGTCLGQSPSDLVGHFGATPVAQQSVGAVIPTTGVVTGGVFSTSTLTIAFVQQVAAIVQALKNLGLSS